MKPLEALWGLAENPSPQRTLAAFWALQCHFRRLNLGKATWNLIAKYIDVRKKNELGF